MPKLIATALVTAGLTFSMAGAAEAQSRCPGEGGVRSLAGDTPTSIQFRAVGENDETQFKIYWLDYQGRRVFYKHLFAGQSYTQQTYMTHPWLVTAPVPGGGEDCLEIYKPRRGGGTIVLR